MPGRRVDFTTQLKCLVVVGILFCFCAQAGEERSLDDIETALWQSRDGVSLQEMLASLDGTAKPSRGFAGVFCEACRRADAEALPRLIEVPFEVGPESPVAIDLGEIRVGDRSGAD